MDNSENNKTPSAVKNIISRVISENGLDRYSGRRALVSSPFGQEYFDSCLLRWKKSRAVRELASAGELVPVIITSERTKVQHGCGWINIVQTMPVPDWKEDDVYLGRFFKWALPFLFAGIESSIYIDSDFFITNRPEKLRRVFDEIDKNGFVVTLHDRRKGWKEEYGSIIKSKRALDLKKIEKQKDMLLNCGVPGSFPVFQTGFLGRKHGADIGALNAEVLEQIKNFSERDQLGIMYAMHKTGKIPFYRPGGDIIFTVHCEKINWDRVCFIETAKIWKRPCVMVRFKTGLW